MHIMTQWPVFGSSHIGDVRDEARLVLAERVWVNLPHQIDAHRHMRGQFVYAGRGTLEMESGGRSHLVPPRFAVWIPPGVAHAIVAPEPVEYCSLFVDPAACGVLSPSMQLMQLNPLVCELSRSAASVDSSRIRGAEARLHAVILDQLAMLPPVRRAVPLPQSPRLQGMARKLLADCHDQRDLDSWAGELCMSTRTLVRRFKQETGMSFGRWLRLVRIVKAMELLEAGKSVSSTALEVGYQQVSAFIAMFRRETGMTPSQYLEQMY